MSKELFRADKHVYGGSVPVLICWENSGSFLATCGSNRRVIVFTRNGTIYDEFALPGPGPALAIDWDKDGEQLAVLQKECTSITIWQRLSKKQAELSTNLKEPTMLIWSRASDHLAIGTNQGNLLMYNSRTKRKVPILGKHPKKITCGAWNKENLIALGSIDKIVTVSDVEGRTIDQTVMKGEPISMKFSEKKIDSKKASRESTLSMKLGTQTVFMYDVDDTSNTVELAFQAKYGDIVDYHWYGDGYILAAFSHGYIVVISTHMKEIGEELHCLKVHENDLKAVALSLTGRKFASSGPDGVRIIDMDDLREIKMPGLDTPSLKGIATNLQWTSDGQILTISTNTGCVASFLVSLPNIGAGYRNKSAYLSSLREISVIDRSKSKGHTTSSVPVDMEPSFIAVGSRHVAAGMNNHVRIYRISDRTPVYEGDCLGTVEQILLNDAYCAVLSNKSIQFHNIEAVEGDHNSRVFPERGDQNISCMALTERFLIFGNSAGGLFIHSVREDMKLLNEFRHSCGIRALYANSLGTRILFVDESSNSFVFNPVDNSLVEVPQPFPSSPSDVHWDTQFPWSFVAMTDDTPPTALEFVYVPQALDGPTIEHASTTNFSTTFKSLSFHDGKVYGLRQTNVVPLPLTSADSTSKPTEDRLRQFIALRKLEEALDLALTTNSGEKTLLAIAQKALEELNIDLAMRAFRQTGSSLPQMVALESIKDTEDLHVLSGHLFAMRGEFDHAEEMFLESSQPRLALDLRRDLLHWEHALRLSATLAPELEQEICREHAHQLEFKGKFEAARHMYQQALANIDSSSEKESFRSCQAGLCRTTLQLGDVQKGRELAYQMQDKAVLRECAAILEGMKQFNDAAEMYVKCEAHEKAAKIYIASKNFRLAGPLMQYITAPKLHAQYAKAKERDGDFAEAERAYEIAKDVNAVVRLNLEHLEAAKAFAIVRRTRSAQGAEMIAQYCRANRDFESSIEFLLLAQKPDEAFQLAQTYGQVEFFLQCLGDEGTPEQHENIALYFENRKDFSSAAKFRQRLGDYQRALRLYLMSGEECLKDAIDLVRDSKGRPESASLFRALQRFLSGDADGKAKDPRHMFHLFIATEEYTQAAKIASVISADEQRMGNYKSAHDILLDTYKELSIHKVPLPEDLRRSFVLLHSYVLVKTLVKAGDHLSAARMLIRVAKNISKFGSHVVPILTSTVIECQRADLKRSSHEYASMLMRPEYRQQLDAKYKRKIETIVRRGPQEEDEEAVSPCPYCKNEIAETLLDCPFCKNSLPFCSVTGRHMVASEWSECPSCQAPALRNLFRQHVKEKGSCSMCGDSLELSNIRDVKDPLAAERTLVTA